MKQLLENELVNVSGGCITAGILGFIYCLGIYKERRVRRNIINNLGHHAVHRDDDHNHVAIPMPEGGGNIDLNN